MLARSLFAVLICAFPFQWIETEALAPGTLLVASDKLGDPNFAETVVLITQRDTDEGTIGLILNRPLDTTLNKVFPSLHAGAEPVYAGGPVAPEAVHALLRSSEKVETADRVVGDIYSVSRKVAIEKLIAERLAGSKFRVYMGYAGWGRRQLENEVRLGAWTTVRGTKYVFDTEPATLWDRLNRESQSQVAAINRNATMKACSSFALLCWR